MAGVVIMTCAAVFLLISALLYNVGMRADAKAARLAEVRGNLREEKETRRERKSPLTVLQERIKSRQQSKVLDEQLSGGKKKKKSGPVEQMLLMAEVPLTYFQFLVIKILLAGSFAFAAWKASALIPDESLGVLAPAMGGCFGMILPGRWLKSKAEKKKATYRDALPDIMDLLVVSVEAGLGFDSALIRLYGKDKSPLMEELMRTIQDVQHGMSKKEAYGNMASRCQVKEISSFLNALIQAEQLGISVKSVLRTQSDALREGRRQRAEEKALKAPVTMLVPLVVFIFPVIFIVLLGPALMNIMEILG